MAVTICASQAIQYCKTRTLFTKVGRTNAQRSKERLTENIDAILHAVEFGIRQSMASGDMDTFQKAAKLQQDIKGWQELSLFDANGVITYSSDSARLKTPLEQELKGRLFSKADRFEREAGGVIEVYQPELVSKSCIECHTDWKQNSIAGILLYRFSKEGLVQVEAESVALTREANQDTLFVAAIALGSTLLVVVLLAQLITRPVAARLGKFAAALSDTSEQVKGGAGQVSSSSQSLAEGASEQAASLEETSSSLEEMSSMTQRNAENAGKVKELGSEARAAGDTAVGDMQAMRTAMDAIKTSSDDIAKIIKTIDEIAFQTNILALNAAVEAARAGEAGAGFAVVADEVRSLAQRCAQAAKETATKIEDSVNKSANGVEISARVAKSLEEIVGKARQVDELAGEVAAASKEQTQGISQVNMAVSQMDKVTQSNAANAEESAAAAEELNAQAEAMKDAVNDLLRLVDGQGGRAGTSAVTASSSRSNGLKRWSGKAQKPAATNGNGNGNGGHQPNGQAKSPERSAQPALATASRRSEIPLEGDFKEF